MDEDRLSKQLKQTVDVQWPTDASAMKRYEVLFDSITEAIRRHVSPLVWRQWIDHAGLVANEILDNDPSPQTRKMMAARQVDLVNVATAGIQLAMMEEATEPTKNDDCEDTEE